MVRLFGGNVIIIIIPFSILRIIENSMLDHLHSCSIPRESLTRYPFHVVLIIFNIFILVLYIMYLLVKSTRACVVVYKLILNMLLLIHTIHQINNNNID